jgi:hypothetical protein
MMKAVMAPKAMVSMPASLHSRPIFTTVPMSYCRQLGPFRATVSYSMRSSSVPANGPRAALVLTPQATGQR